MSDRAVAPRTGRGHDLGAWPPPPPDPGPRGAVVVRLAVGMVVLTAAMLAVGLAITRLDALSGVRAWDASIESWWAAHRTPTLDSLTHVGSSLSDTVTAVVVTVVAVLALRAWLGRWYESVVVVVSIGGELLYFLVLTAVVGRHRPDVPHLDPAPPTSSYPSGHVGAAVALYVCLAFLVARYARNRVVAAVVPVLLCLVPFVVAVSRMYRGMHFPTDVLMGAVGGLAWLAVVLRVLMTGEPRGDVELATEPEPEERTVDVRVLPSSPRTSS